ncbi:MAG: hypothetical protein AB1505_31470 [Candidatus Latescibacterota bacterium]
MERSARVGAVLVAAIVMLGCPAPGGAVGFADPGLEEAVRAALGSGPGEIDVDRAGALSELDASERGIRRLDGIEVLAGLVALNLAFNEIADLGPLAALRALERLDLEGNRIAEVAPLSGLLKLSLLNLSGNAVTSIAPLVGLPALLSLEVRDNPLDAASVSQHLLGLRARGVEVGYAGVPPEPEPVEGWENLGPSLPAGSDTSVYAVAACAAQADRVYAGTSYGLWRSDDGGATWGLTRLLEPVVVGGILTDPVDPQRVLAGGSVFQAADARYIGRWRRSTDGGDTWEYLEVPGDLVGAGLGPARQVYVAVSAADYYRKAQPCTLRVSRDGGLGWTAAAAGGLSYYYSGGGFAWAHPADPDLCYAGAIGWDEGPAIALLVRSADGGQTWQEVDPHGMAALAPDPADRWALYGMATSGLWHSGDGGQTWELRWRSPVIGLAALTVHPSNRSWLWAYSSTRGRGFTGSLWQSHDGGTTWSRSPVGPDAPPQPLPGGFLPHAQDPTRALLLGERRRAGDWSFACNLYRTEDSGQSWERVSLRVPGLAASSVAVGPAGTLYAATARLALGLGPGAPVSLPALQRRAPRSGEWRAQDVRGATPITGRLTLLHVDPLDTLSILAYLDGQGYLGTRDGGRSWGWQDVGTTPTGPSPADPTPAPCVAPGGPQGRTLYALDPRSASLGAREGGDGAWQVLRQGVWCLAVSRGAPEAVYVSDLEWRLVHRSLDGGRSWSELARQPRGAVYALAVDPHDLDGVYAATQDSLFHSPDGGGAWQAAGALPAAAGPLRDLCLRAPQPGVLLLLGHGRLYGSADAGRTWVTLADESTPMPPLDDVATGPAHPGVIYAATCQGVYRLVWPRQATPVADAGPAPPAAARLFPCYPNPSNAGTTIPFAAAGTGRVQLDLYNAGGQPVRGLLDEVPGPGLRRVYWDGRTADGRPAASGVYLCRLRTTGPAGEPLVQVRRLALVR